VKKRRCYIGRVVHCRASVHHRDGMGQQFCSLARPKLTWNCPARPVYAKLQHIFWPRPARNTN